MSAEKLYDIVDKVHELSTLCSLTFSTVISYFDEACKKEYSPMEKVRNYLEENYSKPITLDDVLTVYGHSKTKLCRDFKIEYGESIFEMLTRIRLKNAKIQLEGDTALKVKDVALACGFADCSYFCRMYRRAYGESPRGGGKDLKLRARGLVYLTRMNQ